MKKGFFRGIADGMPIFFGYISIGFAFGIYAISSGLTAKQGILISLFNVTSAGQFAAVPIMVSGGGIPQLMFSQFVINMRYALMSVSLSQKFDNKINLLDRLIIAFVNTDEVFAVAVSNKNKVSKIYMYGLILPPYFGWAIGTALGAIAGNILPQVVTSALTLAIYGMFVAIVMPPARENKACGMSVLIAIVLSCIFYFVPHLSSIPSGISVIISAVAAALIMAAVSPIETEVDIGET